MESLKNRRKQGNTFSIKLQRTPLLPFSIPPLLKETFRLTERVSDVRDASLLCSMASVNLSHTLTFWRRSFTFTSNKSPTWCNSFSVYYPDVCLQLNMFRAFFRPSSGALWLQWQPLVLPSYRGDSRAVFVSSWATHKRQVLNLWNCCILLVNLFECLELLHFKPTGTQSNYKADE